jgi:hypothetical protein
MDTKTKSGHTREEMQTYLDEWKALLDSDQVDLDRRRQEYQSCRQQFEREFANALGVVDVKALAERLSGAYSTDRYRNGWSGCIRMLIKRGYTEAQIEAIIRSKWTRWAADGSEKRYGQVTSTDLARFLDTDQGATLEAVDQMVAESLTETADIIAASHVPSMVRKQAG